MALARVNDGEPVGPGLPDPLGLCLSRLAHRLVAHCLVEAHDGAVIGHALRGDAPPRAFADAVLRRDAGHLTRMLRGARSVAVLPGGPLLAARTPGWSGQVVGVPLARAERRVGWLWLLMANAALDAEVMTGAAAQVTATVCDAAAEPSDAPILAALRGSVALPAAIQGVATLAWVAAIAGSTPQVAADDLRRALLAGRSDDAVRVVTDSEVERTYVVLLTTDRSAEQVREELQVLGRRASDALTGALRMALSEPADPRRPLDTARTQAEAALPHAAPGHCVLMQEVRSRAWLDLLEPALTNLPDLGPNPIAVLMAQGGCRGRNHMQALLVWLNTHGDVALAAEILGLHHNTLRHRLKRARAVLGLDLDDPAVRLELHLRLRAAARKDNA